MTAAAAKVRANRRSRPVYLVVARAGDVPKRTGILAPLTQWDERTLRERKLGVGMEVRAELKARRNVKFHRLTHAIGAMCAEQIEAFAGLDGHGALKKLQMDSGVACEVQEMDASLVIEAILEASKSLLGDKATQMLASVLPEIRTIRVKVPQSIAFDSMEESEFQAAFKGFYEHLRVTYFPTMSEDEVERMVECYEAQQA
jgi:hypothetical protein